MKHQLGIVSLVVIAALLVVACGATPTPTAVRVPPTATKAAAAATTPAAAACQPLAKAKEGTLLRKIQDRGKLLIGVKYDVPLFGYLNPQTNAVEGFDVAIGKEIAKKIFCDDKKVDWQQAVSKDRIPFLQQDVVDLVISTMTINADREQQIDFSNVYYLAGQSLLVPKDSPIKSYKDLAGKNVCSAKGSTSEANVRKYAPQANVILFDSYSECVTAMQGKHADAVTTDDNILLGFASQDKNLTLAGGQFTAEPYGIGIKKGNPETVELVNGVLKDLKTSGKWKDLFKTEIADKTGVAVLNPPIDDWRETVKGIPQP